MRLAISAARRPRVPASSSGEDHFSAIRSDASSPRPLTIKKKPSTVRSTSTPLMKLAATGRSFATAGSTAMRQSPTASLTDSEMRAQGTETPAALGYRMPAEWEPHEATWIAWPHNAQDWPGKFQGIQWTYVDIVRHLSKHERVHILVNDQTAEAKTQRTLDRSNVRLDNIHFHKWVTDRVWTRDSGPIFVKHNDATEQIAVLNWQFNAWAKYSDWHNDDALPGLVAAQLRMKMWEPSIEIDGQQRRIVLEGGSI